MGNPHQWGLQTKVCNGARTGQIGGVDEFEQTVIRFILHEAVAYGLRQLAWVNADMLRVLDRNGILAPLMEAPIVRANPRKRDDGV